MLEELRIRDLGVITDATLPLGPGLSVVTGETGAGKTMVVTAVGLLLGARSDAGAVRSGAKSASAEATVRLDAGHPAVARAREAGAEVEEFDGGAELLLARSVGADGRGGAGHFHARSGREIHGAPAVAPEHALRIGAVQDFDGEPGPG